MTNGTTDSANRRRPSWRAWLVYAVGIFAYVIAVTQRTTIGVAGVAATERFQVDAAVLSSLAVMQLLVYAGLQVPVGVLMDRFGPKKLIVVGTALMLLGQIAVGLAPQISIAVLGRVLVGAGDAAVFTSVMRLTASWFHGRLVPQLSQWIGNLGQLGQVLSAVPFAFLLNQTGWTTAFLSAASASLLALVLSIAVVSDRPASAPAPARPESWAHSLRALRSSLARPGTRLGFWAHFSTQSPGIIFSMMWGYPFMVYALGYAPSTASGMLVVPVATAVVAGPVLGVLSARFPFRRSNVVLAVIVLMGLAWAAVLLWPGVPPFWLMVVLLITLGIGGPGSVFGFDFARMFNPARSLGSANGVVNTGGFTADVLMIFLIGLVLDVLNRVSGGTGAEDLYSLGAFRVAFLVQFVVVGVGVLFILGTRRKARRNLAEDEGVAVGPLWTAVARRWRSGPRSR